MIKPLMQGVLLCCTAVSVQSFALGYSSDYEVCMRDAKSQSENIAACQKKELKVQNKRMKKLYKLTLNNASDSEQSLVEQSQTVWLQQLNNACNVSGKKLKEYTLSNSSCALHMTLSHTDMMEVRLKNKILK
ncbi:lysozyme inhibitor LprI family protein [Acinetobacter pragensis]|uniref:lysozyme inhibitor LprI family protein n=1 Tax=Acinetobacter pragensis TaxID=1806892 RepID=UPI003342C16C